MKVVTFSIFKGGTAKTTSTVNTAAALAKKGLKVLVVDLDHSVLTGPSCQALNLKSKQATQENIGGLV